MKRVVLESIGFAFIVTLIIFLAVKILFCWETSTDSPQGTPTVEGR